MEGTIKKQSNHSLRKFKNFRFSTLKTVSKFLAPLFFFSVVLSCSSLLSLVFNLVEFLSCNVHKNYMFLLCNAILVFLVKSSGLMGASSDHQEISFYGGRSTSKEHELAEMKAGIAEEKVVMEVKEVKEMEEDKSLILVTESKNVPLITEDEDGGEENKIEILDEEEEEDDDAEVEAIELLSTEELNRKFENFIRKMKEEIKIEAQELIMVRY